MMCKIGYTYRKYLFSTMNFWLRKLFCGVFLWVKQVKEIHNSIFQGKIITFCEIWKVVAKIRQLLFRRIVCKKQNVVPTFQALFLPLNWKVNLAGFFYLCDKLPIITYSCHASNGSTLCTFVDWK